MSKHSEVVPNSTLIDDAAAALGRAGFSRRSFLVGAGALVVSFSMKGALQTALAQGPFEGGTAGSAPLNQLDSWIAIAADGGVTAYTGKAELGQGISTAQIQLVAEELCVPFSRVKLMYCDTVQTPDQGITSGSQSHPTNFNQKNLAQAAATAREALLKLASKRLGFSADQLVAKDGVISAKIDPSKKVGYGDLVGAKKLEEALDLYARVVRIGAEAKVPDEQMDGVLRTYAMLLQHAKREDEAAAENKGVLSGVPRSLRSVCRTWPHCPTGASSAFPA